MAKTATATAGGCDQQSQQQQWATGGGVRGWTRSPTLNGRNRWSWTTDTPDPLANSVVERVECRWLTAFDLSVSQWAAYFDLI
jgi:hypothetical protein